MGIKGALFDRVNTVAAQIQLEQVRQICKVACSDCCNRIPVQFPDCFIRCIFFVGGGRERERERESETHSDEQRIIYTKRVPLVARACAGNGHEPKRTRCDTTQTCPMCTNDASVHVCDQEKQNVDCIECDTHK